ncbi:hypothetical protein PAXRUDRAFT_31948 [Paxillus rubicundulus Ve08.2h10]|uniref:Uncharacterized protein n=1 Tax=Paxillus rubicundulus Ve08.2h10 TaxID=930991 RepID=A0A0D0E6M4_9AGAM|nr:hypothetical protein PAXRUDRAFT_31948 [Paxillus rubicundulus Ve08.2h10]
MAEPAPRQPMPSLRCANEPPALHQQSRQEYAQWPPRPTEHGTYDYVPRGSPVHGPRQPLPPLQAHDQRDTHYQSPQGTTHFISPDEQYPVPIHNNRTIHPAPYENLYNPEYPLPDTATPPQHDPAQPFIPASPRPTTQDPRHHPSFVEQYQPASPPHPVPMHSVIPPHHMTNQHSYQRPDHRPAEAESTEPARSDTASRSTINRLSPSTVEEIFTRGTAPVLAGEEFPRDQSPPPRPTMPPWQLVGEKNALGLHDGDTVETVVINGVPVTAFRRSPKHAGTMDNPPSKSSPLSDIVLLELPEVDPWDSPEQRKARKAMWEYWRAANRPPHVVWLTGHEADGVGKPERKEPKGKERARDEPIAEQSPPSPSAAEFQRQNDTEYTAHSSSALRSYVRKTEPTTRGIIVNVPPVASSANPLHPLFPKQSQIPPQLATPSLAPRACTPKETQNESSVHYCPQAPNLMPRSPLPIQAEALTLQQTQTQSTRYLTPPETPNHSTSEVHVQTATQDTNESRESVESGEFETNLHFNLGVLARQCLRDVGTMAMAFARCNMLSSEAFDSARSAYTSLSLALTATLGPMDRQVDMNIDLTDGCQLSWRDRYEGTVASMHRTMNRVSSLLNEFPRGDRIRRHLASVSTVTERLNYLTRKLEDSMDRIIYLRLASQLKASITAIRKAKITEEARRKTFKSFSERKKLEMEDIRQRMDLLEAQNRALRSDSNFGESGLESAED